MSRILILYAAAHGKGHESAARALESELSGDDRVGTVITADAFDYGSELYRRLYATFYRELSENMSALWERVYDAADSEAMSFLDDLRKLLDRAGVTELHKLVADYGADRVVCTHFLPIHVLAWHTARGNLGVPLYAVVTDYTAHRYWVAEEVERYFVASTKIAAMLQERGVAPSRVSVTGIPVDPTLGSRDPEALRRKHAIDRSPIATLVCSAIDPPLIRSMVDGIVAAGTSGTLIAVAGRSPEAAEALEGVEGNDRLDVVVVSGFVDYLEELVAVSDLLITKAGGLIVSETLAQGVPMLLVEPLGGQETWNADYVVSTGAGVQARVPEMVPEIARSLLDDPERLRLMKERAGSGGRPEAASLIARSILDA